MKHFLKIKRSDKKTIKMINQSEKGFELVITSEYTLNNFMEEINKHRINNDEINIVWQMKYKQDNYIIYKNCEFSEPEKNFFFEKNNVPIILGKKIKIKCSGVQYYSNSIFYKNSKVKKSTHSYKDANLLERMMKISELDSKSE